MHESLLTHAPQHLVSPTPCWPQRPASSLAGSSALFSLQIPFARQFDVADPVFDRDFQEMIHAFNDHIQQYYQTRVFY
ncbi:hypothetical protein MRB53_018150 [Persea americana]|uniref:Uncharacterized protein n=1 Tax=Persea americana TaxID=3435 RepID=A0ACC2M6M9_PERAE|nr:hypothetical protein MRB53_018150 [Persea americana]